MPILLISRCICKAEQLRERSKGSGLRGKSSGSPLITKLRLAIKPPTHHFLTPPPLIALPSTPTHSLQPGKLHLHTHVYTNMQVSATGVSAAWAILLIFLPDIFLTLAY